MLLSSLIKILRKIFILPAYFRENFFIQCLTSPVSQLVLTTSSNLVLIRFFNQFSNYKQKNCISREGKKSMVDYGHTGHNNPHHPYHASTLSDSTLYNLPFPRSYIPKYYPSYTYAPNMYLQKEPIRWALKLLYKLYDMDSLDWLSKKLTCVINLNPSQSLAPN